MKPVYTNRRIIDHRATGAAVRRKRKLVGLSLRELARQIKVSAPFLSDLERGNRNWNEERLAQVEKVLT